MSKSQEEPSVTIDLREGDLIVGLDYCSTGLWIYDGVLVRNTPYSNYHLPGALVERFKYWTGWYNIYGPYDEGLDWDLLHAYGRSLAVDLKRLVGNEKRVFYGFRADNERHCSVSSEEILLPDEQKVQAAIPPD
jgi:hypothetical protein